MNRFDYLQLLTCDKNFFLTYKIIHSKIAFQSFTVAKYQSIFF
jgi:hypothetical protein